MSNCIVEAARYLAAEPAAVDRALAQHHRLPDGRCGGCGHAPPKWPCATASSARAALEILGGAWR